MPNHPRPLLLPLPLPLPFTPSHPPLPLSRCQLPPGRVGMTGIRETLEYLADPRAFIKKRVALYGRAVRVDSINK